MTEERTHQRGTHDQFVAFYDHFLDAAYAPPGPFNQHLYGRERLVESIVDEINKRGAKRILDCAAGTGFPVLDLAAGALKHLVVHCTDGDSTMVAALIKRARQLGIPIERLVPDRRPLPERPTDRLVMDWADLDQVDGQYDYVLCRGNSLAYTDTWRGREEVATCTSIARHLSRMIDRIRPGGHLHVDAPWSLELASSNYRTMPPYIVWEKVSIDRGRREWWLKYQRAEEAVEFKRYSTLLTINEVELALKSLDLEETSPMQLKGERNNWATIIARKPLQPA